VQVEHIETQETHAVIAAERLGCVDVQAEMFLQTADEPDSQLAVRFAIQPVETDITKGPPCRAQLEITARAQARSQEHGGVAMRHRKHDFDRGATIVRRAIDQIETRVNGAPRVHQSTVPTRIADSAERITQQHDLAGHALGCVQHAQREVQLIDLATDGRDQQIERNVCRESGFGPNIHAIARGVLIEVTHTRVDTRDVELIARE